MTLREDIIAEMQRYENKMIGDLGNTYYRKRYAAYCTWWFKKRFKIPTAQVRTELVRMEKEGLVTADRSQSNNTKWLLVDPAADRVGEP